MDADQDTEIEVTETPVISADEGIEKLKQQLDAERRARSEAERKAHEMAAQAANAKAEVHDTNIHLLDASIEQLSNNQEALKAAYADALRRGDHGRAAQINDELLETKLNLGKLEAGKEELVRRAQQQPVVPLPAERLDPVEAFASQLSPKSADWIRAHPECVTDGKLQRKMVRAHEDALEDNIRPDTPEYFEFIERRLGIADQQQDADDGYAAKQVSRRDSDRQPPAAPVSRGSGGSVRGVRLSPAEREIARDMGWTEEKYAEWKLESVKRGQMQ